jgi:hypothetical protein
MFSMGGTLIPKDVIWLILREAIVLETGKPMPTYFEDPPIIPSFIGAPNYALNKLSRVCKCFGLIIRSKCLWYVENDDLLSLGLIPSRYRGEPIAGFNIVRGPGYLFKPGSFKYVDEPIIQKKQTSYRGF